MMTKKRTHYVGVISLAEDPNAPLTGEDAVANMTCLENLHYWLGTIHGYAPRAPISVVGSKADMVSEELRDQRVKLIEDSLRGTPYHSQIVGPVVAASSKNEGDAGVETVRQDIQNNLINAGIVLIQAAMRGALARKHRPEGKLVIAPKSPPQRKIVGLEGYVSTPPHSPGRDCASPPWRPAGGASAAFLVPAAREDRGSQGRRHQAGVPERDAGAGVFVRHRTARRRSGQPGLRAAYAAARLQRHRHAQAHE